MSNALSSAVFFSRNVGKVNHGAIDRIGATTAQGLGLVGKLSKTEGAIGGAARTAIKGIDSVSKTTAGVSGEALCATAGKLVNKLLVVGAGIRVLTSDDKERALYKETAAMGAMLGAEKLVKSDACQTIIKKGSEQVTKGLAKGLEHFNVKLPGKAGKIINAVLAAAALVGASIAAYDAGAKAGTYVVDKKREIANVYSTDKNHENANLSIKS